MLFRRALNPFGLLGTRKWNQNTLLRILGEKQCSFRKAFLGEKDFGLNLGGGKSSRGLGRLDNSVMISTQSFLCFGERFFCDFLACWQVVCIGRSVKWNMLQAECILSILFQL